MNKKRVLFLFNRKRAERARLVEAGRYPDEGLYGFFTLKKRGFDCTFTDAGHFGGIGYKLGKGLEDLLSHRGKRVGFNLNQAMVLRKKIQEADVVFATADSSALPVLLLKKLGMIKTPVVFATIGLARSFPEAKGPVARFYKALMPFADRIIHYGYGEGRILRDAFAVDDSRIRFIPFAVQTDFFDVPQKRTGLPISIGLDHLRDWQLLFDAGQKTGQTLELICNPDMLAGKKIPGTIRPVAPMPMEALREKMAAAQYVLLPVRENPYTAATITLLESMACGAPAIVTRTQAITQGYAFENGKDCLLVNPGDANAFAQAMDQLADDENLRSMLSESGRQTVREHHDIAAYADRLASLFDEVTS